jgi:hypothetical protein
MRVGMTHEQLTRVELILLGIAKVHGAPMYAHHGDCVGADAEFHDIAYKLGYHVVIHPPIDSEHRAWCGSQCPEGHDWRQPMTHFARNRAIVDECDILIAAPYEDQSQPRGGYTVRYAARDGKDRVIVRPGGSCLTLVRGGLPAEWVC